MLMTQLSPQTSSPGLPKAPTGVRGFDAITDGGLPRGRPTLVTGATGTGKTLFAMEPNEPGLADCLAPYNEIAEQILSKTPRASVPKPIGDREIFDIVGGWQ